MSDEHPAAADSSAVRVALWRALHVQVDAPPHVLDDQIGRVIGNQMKLRRISQRDTIDVEAIAISNGHQFRPGITDSSRMRAGHPLRPSPNRRAFSLADSAVEKASAKKRKPPKNDSRAGPYRTGHLECTTSFCGSVRRIAPKRAS